MRKLKLIFPLGFVVFFHSIILESAVADSGVQRVAPQRKPIDVCFTLDTTGSMSGLIEGAKQKIWSIANNIASLKPDADLRFCLLGYRDKGDDYITLFQDLDPDIGAIYEQLKAFQAGGGGDEPESVNQALYESVNQPSWSDSAEAFKVIFLVGDARPHMDYQEIQYPEISLQAKNLGIVINTIQCGNLRGTEAVWRSISQVTHGKYIRLPQSGNVKVISTPMDQDLVALYKKLNLTFLPYGKEQSRQDARQTLLHTQNDREATIADRAAYYAKQKTVNTVSGDLIDDIDRGIVSLDDIEAEQIPVELQGLSRQDLTRRLDEIRDNRKAFRKVFLELDAERHAFIQANLGSAHSAFDLEVTEALAQQITD